MRAREALFSIWQSQSVTAGSRGLDVFAGSGAIGIEALSRGGEQAVFIERNAAALEALEGNLAKLPATLRERARVLAMPVAKALSMLTGEASAFDWIYLDPPFAQADYAALLEALAAPALRHAGTALVAEHLSQAGPPASPAWAPQQTRRFGTVSLSFYLPAPRAPGREG